MFEIEKTFTFEAGHTLKEHDGACKRPHGHSYVLKIAIRKETLERSGPKQGMVIDFQDITALVRPMLNTYLDHAWLNETLHIDSPTAEFIAQWVYEYLEKKIPGLYRVTVCETATSAASFMRV